MAFSKSSTKNKQRTRSLRLIGQPLQIFRKYRTLPVATGKLQELARLLYKKEGLPFSKKISLIFCSDHTIRRLNNRYRNVDRATDVLSFTFDDSDLLGEIYISLPRAAVQARRYHVPYREEVLRLFIHGFYHLLGCDHETDNAKQRMELKEKTAFAAINK
jgi:probable rRNA maturation factor